MLKQVKVMTKHKSFRTPENFTKIVIFRKISQSEQNTEKNVDNFNDKSSFL